MFHTSSVHVYTQQPRHFWQSCCGTLASEAAVLAYVLAMTVLIAAAARRLDLLSQLEGRTILFCGSLALVPILILYGVSMGTSIHIFLDRYCIVAVPGIALCWAFIVSRIDSRALRLLFCAALGCGYRVPLLHLPLFQHSQLHLEDMLWRWQKKALLSTTRRC